MLVGMPLQRIRYNVFLDPAQLDALRALKERDGIVPAEAIRRAIDFWLATKGMKVKAAPRRVSPRRKA